MTTEQGRERLAIISTYGELCGIAAYTHRLERYLDDVYDVECLALDQTVLRSDMPRRIKLGDEHIRRMASRLRQFDHVNIQYEPGTLGPNARVALRRFKVLADAAPSLSVTFHTFAHAEGLPFFKILRKLAKLRVGAAGELAREWRRKRLIGQLVFKHLKRLERDKHVSLIVHTKREASTLTIDSQFKNVHDHPLAFLRDEDVAEARAGASRSLFPPLTDVPPGAKIIGVFGFIAPYKGTLTAVKAMRSLPEDYHLAIFGGIHPASIQEHEDIDEYLETILHEIAGVSDPDETTDDIDGRLTGLERLGVDRLRKTRSDISHRVHFMGPQDDDKFAHGMCLCDAVVLPYLEVGQTSSGPVSLAVELGCRVVVARNHAFGQFASYHKDRMDFFDIGNHVELADRVLHPIASAKTTTPYGYRTNRDVYVRAHGGEPAGDNADRTPEIRVTEGARVPEPVS